MIKTQKTKMPSNAKCLFFSIFNILKLKMHGLKSILIYKPIVYKRKTTQAGYSAPSTIPYSGNEGTWAFMEREIRGCMHAKGMYAPSSV